MSGKRTKWLRRLVGEDRLREAKKQWKRLARPKRQGAAMLLQPRPE